MHCSKARDTVDRAIKKHEMKNAEESLPMWEEPSAFVQTDALLAGTMMFLFESAYLSVC